MRTKYIAIVLVILTTILTSGSLPQKANGIINSVSIAFKEGNSSQITKHFNPTIEMELLEDENMFSKAQAELLLKDFFNRYKPTSFKVNHQGTKGNTSFAIGILLTSSGNFRVSIFMKEENEKMLIHQLRIELSE
ncbi:MAG TPA: DUF4783 domain-containing protein [Bacteroidales bacterium]|jgi:hypothetical protein|nr:DUF4783 domain-containing protein [Bacteroidales bacterium]